MRNVKVNPMETVVRETEMYLLTILHYVNEEYESSLQIEFETHGQLRDHVEHLYKSKQWTQTWGENEFWHKENGKMLNDIILIQKIRKHEKITKTLEEDNMML